MPAIPIFAVLAGAAIAGIPPLRQRVLPVAKAVGQAGVGVAAAVLTGAGGVASAGWHGHPHHDTSTAEVPEQ
jgi:hypothetical protein